MNQVSFHFSREDLLQAAHKFCKERFSEVSHQDFVAVLKLHPSYHTNLGILSDFIEQVFQDAPLGPLGTPDPQVKCHKCGLILEQSMNYLCPNSPCPIGLGGITCSTGKP